MSELHSSQISPVPIYQQVVDLACPNCAQDGFAVWEQIGIDHDSKRHLVDASPDFHAEAAKTGMGSLIVCNCCGHVIRA